MDKHSGIFNEPYYSEKNEINSHTVSTGAQETDTEVFPIRKHTKLLCATEVSLVITFG